MATGSFILVEVKSIGLLLFSYELNISLIYECLINKFVVMSFYTFVLQQSHH